MRISVRNIQRQVAADFGIELERFYSRSRLRADCWPRQYAMLLARELTPLSLTVLGRLFGRDHTTVISGLRSAQRRVAADRNLALKIEARKLLLQCEPIIPVDTKLIGFPPQTRDFPQSRPQPIHNAPHAQLLADPQPVAA
jgi:hypothetical protein